MEWRIHIQEQIGTQSCMEDVIDIKYETLDVKDVYEDKPKLIDVVDVKQEINDDIEENELMIKEEPTDPINNNGYVLY